MTDLKQTPPVSTIMALGQGGPWIVGSDDVCDVVIRDETISGQHLAITALEDGGHFEIRDLSSERGTWVHGQQIQQARVTLWQMLRLGAHPIRLAQIFNFVEMSPDKYSLTVGRADTADIVISDMSVSRQHIRVSLRGDKLRISDLASRFGVFIDGERLRFTAIISLTSELRLGVYEVPPEMLASWHRWLKDQSESFDSINEAIPIPVDGTLILGRSPDADMVLNDAQVSWTHAQLTATGGRWRIRDLGSSNGTYVNGTLVEEGPLSPDDQLALGTVMLSLQGGGIRRSEQDPPEIRVDALHLERTLPDGTRLLDSVSLTMFPGELIGVMGPSGSGKTTLLDSLSGRAPLTSGQVLYNRRDLHENFDLLNHRIAYVSQEDVMHPELLVYEVVYFAALLRLPGDAPSSAVRTQVDRVLDQMGLTKIQAQRVGGRSRRGISGGQRRRVSIAVQLVTDPAVIFLDEPTSGLDAAAALDIVRILWELASTGKTVVMTVHQPRVEVFGLLGRLLLLDAGGRLAWFGPTTPQAIEYFSRESTVPRPPDANPADWLLDVIDPPGDLGGRTPEEWKASFLASDAYQQYVAQWQQDLAEKVRTPPSALPSMGRHRSQRREFRHLTHRYLLRKARDRGTLTIQLIQAPVIAGLAGWLFDKGPSFGLGLPKLCVLSEVLPTLFLLGAAALWFGCSNVARELVGDRPIYIRERLTGLSAPAYLSSIFAVQLGIAAIQTLLLLAIAWPLVGLAGSTFLPAWLLLLTTSACGISMGLLLSSVAPTEVSAISSVPLLLLPQLMLSGYLKLFREMDQMQQLSTHLNPMLWTFEGLVGLEYAAADRLSVVGECLGFEGSGLMVPIAVLAGQSATLLGLTVWKLSRTQGD